MTSRTGDERFAAFDIVLKRRGRGWWKWSTGMSSCAARNAVAAEPDTRRSARCFSCCAPAPHAFPGCRWRRPILSGGPLAGPRIQEHQRFIEGLRGRPRGVPEAVERVQLWMIPQSLEERMSDLPFGRLRAVLDLGQQLRLDPDALVGDPLGVAIGARSGDRRNQHRGNRAIGPGLCCRPANPLCDLHSVDPGRSNDRFSDGRDLNGRHRRGAWSPIRRFNAG
jgi:hypothetical protein